MCAQHLGERWHQPLRIAHLDSDHDLGCRLFQLVQRAEHRVQAFDRLEHLTQQVCGQGTDLEHERAEASAESVKRRLREAAQRKLRIEKAGIGLEGAATFVARLRVADQSRSLDDEAEVRWYLRSVCGVLRNR